jgi:hypothetical protein
VKLKTNAGFINGVLWSLISVIKGQRSFLISLPTAWVQVFCKPNDKGRYLVGYKQAGDEIVIKAYRGDHDSH